jgi:hypothetical protein
MRERHGGCDLGEDFPFIPIRARQLRPTAQVEVKTAPTVLVGESFRVHVQRCILVISPTGQQPLAPSSAEGHCQGLAYANLCSTIA